MPKNNIKDQNEFYFNKRYGQNFLTDTNLLDSIVADSGITETDVALEIGAGAGTLTKRIALKAKKVVTYEIDKRLEPVLAKEFDGLNNTEYRICDFMDEEISKLREEFENAVVIANLPYYITTPIIMRLLENRIGKSITVMIQQEVAERLTAKPNTKEYGSITAKIDLYGGAAITRKVSRKLFYPEPHVDSAVIHIERSEAYKGSNPELTDQIIKLGFLMRRKTLVNNLANIASKEELSTCLKEIGFDPSIRAESLSAQDFVRLSDVIFKRNAQNN